MVWRRMTRKPPRQPKKEIKCVGPCGKETPNAFSTTYTIKLDKDGGNIGPNLSDLGRVAGTRAPGVPADDRDKIFERFFRADDSRQAVGIHAGLGLSIVRGYVSLLGGTISLESEVGRGSTFRVQVPSAVVV